MGTNKGWSFRGPLANVDILRVLREADEAGAEIITLNYRNRVHTFIKEEIPYQLEKHNIGPCYGKLKYRGIGTGARLNLFEGEYELYTGECTPGGKYATNWLYVIVENHWEGSEQPAKDIASALAWARGNSARLERTIVRTY